MTFVVVGAGPDRCGNGGSHFRTGPLHAEARIFAIIDPADARVILVEAGPRVLPTFSGSLRECAEAASRPQGRSAAE